MRYLLALLVMVLLAGCIAPPHEKIKQFSSAPDPGDTNNWSTPAQTGDGRRLVRPTQSLLTLLILPTRFKLPERSETHRVELEP